jgi:hypothetical protein
MGNYDNDRNNYYDKDRTTRISKQQFISKYGDAAIKAAGDDPRANIYPEN